MVTCFVQNDNVFTQIMMISPKKVDDLRAREREREEKGTTNSAPRTFQLIYLHIFLVSAEDIAEYKKCIGDF